MIQIVDLLVDRILQHFLADATKLLHINHAVHPHCTNITTCRTSVYLNTHYKWASEDIVTEETTLRSVLHVRLFGDEKLISKLLQVTSLWQREIGKVR